MQRFLVSALTLSLGFSLLTGCGKSSSPAPAAGDASSSGNADASAPAASAGAKASTPAAKSGGPAELRLKWTPGQRQYQRMSMNMKSETSGGPMPNPIKQVVTMNMESTMTPSPIREGSGQELEMEMGDTDMSVMMGEREVMSFDSRGESLGDGNPAAGMFRAMVGTKLKYQLNASNRVEKVEGWQQVAQKMSGQAPAAGRGMLAGMMNEEYFKQMADFGRGVPNRTVQPGDSWAEKQEISLGPLGRVIMDLTYTFKGWESHDKQECAAVSFAGTVQTKTGDAASTNSLFGKMEVKDGKVNGTYWLNPATGRLTETTLDQDLKLVMDIAGLGRPAPAGTAPGATTVTTAMNQKIQMKFSAEPLK